MSATNTKNTKHDKKASDRNVSVQMVDDKPSVSTDRRLSQWEELMKKFSETHKTECKTASLDIPRAPRSVKLFPTGSTYEGTWNVLGMSGFGTYNFTNNVIYKGEFADGVFESTGDLIYPSGAILRGTWKNGYMTERKLIFADGLEYSEDDWKYCRMPDRRFTIEYDNGLQPGGKSFLTAEQPTREIPPGYYDTGDGFYDPVTKTVYNADDITSIVRSPSTLEQKWIVDNCRRSPDDPVGPQQHLYEKWSEPQVDPELAPPPAAATCAHGYRKSNDSYDSYREFDDSSSVFYQWNWRSRTSNMASRSSAARIRFKDTESSHSAAAKVRAQDKLNEG